MYGEKWLKLNLCLLLAKPSIYNSDNLHKYNNWASVNLLVTTGIWSVVQNPKFCFQGVERDNQKC